MTDRVEEIRRRLLDGIKAVGGWNECQFQTEQAMRNHAEHKMMTGIALIFGGMGALDAPGGLTYSQAAFQQAVDGAALIFAAVLDGGIENSFDKRRPALPSKQDSAFHRFLSSAIGQNPAPLLKRKRGRPTNAERLARARREGAARLRKAASE